MLAFVMPRTNLFRLMMAGASLAKALGAQHWLPGKLGNALKLVPGFPKPPAETDRPQVFPAQGTKRGRVALLAGCVQPVLRPEINAATIRLLEPARRRGGGAEGCRLLRRARASYGLHRPVAPPGAREHRRPGRRAGDLDGNFTIACDGRHSMVRERAGLEVEEIGAPMDVLWFRAGKRETESESLFARVDPGRMMVTFDRGDYWQCAYVIAKGQYDAVKARGLTALLDDIARMAPILKAGLADVKSWDDVKLLTVAINRLKRWTRPGLLCIGDAAHAMSPIGGVGVNLAVQDAVATANLLAAKLARWMPVPKTNSTPSAAAASSRCG